ncbi:MAG: hypothetical protein M1820_007000 [Bogoriella megaspora]|nr:MAG: hypothetical protein M1820_007000 [Bogoriella megaspora]
MASAQELQNLLRFLSQDAKVPLSFAMTKVKEMQAAGLHSPDAISKNSIENVNAIFSDQKFAKQILTAAKRVSRKRGLKDTKPSSAKKPRKTASEDVGTPTEIEESLMLPTSSESLADLSSVVLFTNRAPLVLAFAVTLLKYTMPSQPTSSRLSLAQAVVSINSKTKAISLGIENGKTAEDEGWGQGQPVVKVMDRDIRVLKRWGYDWEGAKDTEVQRNGQEQSKSGDTSQKETEPALWGLDLEALKKGNGAGQLPIYTPQSARSYLLRSFDRSSQSNDNSDGKKKRSGAQVMADKEYNLGLLLSTLDLLYSSWAPYLDSAELDRRSWRWYVKVRPDVESGPGGWGGKGDVKLADILSLRRNTQR